MAFKNNSGTDLKAWFSSERMTTYSFHKDPEALYLWNTRMTKAFLEDIQHVEVLLRNHVHKAVSSRYGARWYVNRDIPFDRQARNSIEKAERRAETTQGEAPPPGRVIPELSFDFWRYLFSNRYQATIWPLVKNALVATPIASVEGTGPAIFMPSLADFRNEVDVVYKLRNRCAHHEPIISRNKEHEDDRIGRAQEAISLVATWISPEAAQWIAAHSRIPDLRDLRP